MKLFGRSVVLALGVVWSITGVLPGLAKAEQPAAASVPDRDPTQRLKVSLGIDVLAAGGFAQLSGLRIGLLASDASRDLSLIHI